MRQEIKIGDLVKVNSRFGRGVAFTFRGHPGETREVFIEEDECSALCCGWDYETGSEHDGRHGFYDVETEEDTDIAIVVMVGDDTKHRVPMSDLSPMPEEDYCHACGQVGCAHDGLERE